MIINLEDWEREAKDNLMNGPRSDLEAYDIEQSRRILVLIDLLKIAKEKNHDS